MVLTKTQGGDGDGIQLSRDYVGVPVSAVAETERVLKTLDEGSYVGVFAGNKPVMAFQPDASGLHLPRLAPALEKLVELASEADWDIRFPEDLSQEELPPIVSLADLFVDGRRSIGRGGSANVQVVTPDHLDALRRVVETGGPKSAVIGALGERDITLLGQTFRMPRTRLVVSAVTFPDESLAKIATGTVPLEIEVRFPPDADVVEEIVGPDHDEEE